MAERLSGRTALITGGAKRIGRATALALANEGVNVVINYRKSAAEAGELVDELKRMGVGAWAVRADLSVQAELDGLMEEAWSAAGRIDILINNASIFPNTSFEAVTLDDLIGNITVDAWAPFQLGRQLASRVDGGHIINFLDTKVVSYDWAHVGYIAAKHLLALFTKMMAVKLAPGFAVNAVAPGLILPPEGKDQSYLEALKDRMPLKRIGSPEYVTDAILFLISSNFITGQVIFIDGGRHLNEALLG